MALYCRRRYLGWCAQGHYTLRRLFYMLGRFIQTCAALEDHSNSEPSYCGLSLVDRIVTLPARACDAGNWRKEDYCRLSHPHGSPSEMDPEGFTALQRLIEGVEHSLALGPGLVAPILFADQGITERYTLLHGAMEYLCYRVLNGLQHRAAVKVQVEGAWLVALKKRSLRRCGALRQQPPAFHWRSAILVRVRVDADLRCRGAVVPRFELKQIQPLALELAGVRRHLPLGDVADCGDQRLDLLHERLGHVRAWMEKDC